MQRDVHCALASMGWGMEGTRPDLFDVIGAIISLLGMTVIMYWLRA